LRAACWGVVVAIGSVETEIWIAPQVVLSSLTCCSRGTVSDQPGFRDSVSASAAIYSTTLDMAPRVMV